MSASEVQNPAPTWAERAPSDYSGREPARWPGWRGLIGWDVFLNNLAAGLFVVTVAGWWLAPTAMRAVVPQALAVTLLVLGADLVVLVADLGDPRRFLHMLRVVKPGSPMSVGVWSLTTFSMLLTAVAAGAWLPWPVAQAGAKVAALLGLVPAFGVLVYKGVLFSCTSQPGLRDARWLSAHLAVSGLVLGAAALTLVAAVVASPALAPLRPVLAVLLVLAALTLFALHRDVAPRARERYSRGVRRALFWAAGIGGLAAPLALLVGTSGRGAASLAAALALAGGLVLRHALVRLAEPAVNETPA
jgi:hypothetical protein